MNESLGMALAYKYCVGIGLELGAATHNSFHLPDCPNLSPSDGVGFLFERDLLDYQRYESRYAQQFNTPMAKVDMVGDFQNIPLADKSVDYVISSHVIEHDPNPFAALIESGRVLKDFGVFFCIFPKRVAAEEDRFRALTTLEQMIDAHARDLGMADMPESNWRDHYHVFSLQSMIRAVNYLNTQGLGNWMIECVEETDSKVGNGHTVVLRKFERLASSVWNDDTNFTRDFTAAWEGGRMGEALCMLKIALSFDFFDAAKLHLAAHLSKELNDLPEAVNFLRQALVVEPENEGLREAFFNWTGVVYTNPVL